MDRNEKIWFELEPTTDVEKAKRRCDLANKVLERLGCDMSRGCGFFVNNRGGPSCYIWDDGLAGGFHELTDNGHWLNLTFLATGKPFTE